MLSNHAVQNIPNMSIMLASSRAQPFFRQSQEPALSEVEGTSLTTAPDFDFNCLHFRPKTLTMLNSRIIGP